MAIPMTFAAFQATRIDTADLNTTLKEHGQDWWDDPNVAGCVYGPGGFYIVGPDPKGEYLLTLDRSDFVSTDRALLERKLYDFAVAEGMIDPPYTYSTCRNCDETFAVTRAMIDAHRDASDYVATDNEIANIIEVCPTCAGVEEATDVTKF